MLSIPHMIVVFIVVLVVFGPQKLPELAKGLGKLMAEFRKASTDFKSAFENEMRDLERQAAEVERKKRELLAKANAALDAPITLASPSGSETQPAPPQLADSSSASTDTAATSQDSTTQGERVTEADAGTPMEPVVAPVAEGVVARSPSDEPSTEIANAPPVDADTGAANSNSNGSAPTYDAAQAESDAIAEKPHRTADSPAQNDQNSQDAPHDYRPA
jgi:sec-independent protein translocase protein TatB